MHLTNTDDKLLRCLFRTKTQCLRIDEYRYSCSITRHSIVTSFSYSSRNLYSFNNIYKETEFRQGQFATPGRHFLEGNQRVIFFRYSSSESLLFETLVSRGKDTRIDIFLLQDDTPLYFRLVDCSFQSFILLPIYPIRRVLEILIE